MHSTLIRSRSSSSTSTFFLFVLLPSIMSTRRCNNMAFELHGCLFFSSFRICHFSFLSYYILHIIYKILLCIEITITIQDEYRSIKPNNILWNDISRKICYGIFKIKYTMILSLFLQFIAVCIFHSLFSSFFFLPSLFVLSSSFFFLSIHLSTSSISLNDNNLSITQDNIGEDNNSLYFDCSNIYCGKI